MTLGHWGGPWLGVAVAATLGCLHVWEVSCYHHGLDNLTVLEQKVVGLKTENAFYYSYFEDVVEAPSLREAVMCTLRDERSEAPDVINAVHRFNIYQELLCGLLYRLLSASLGRELIPEPWYFFRYCSYALQGLGRAALAQLVFTVGGGGLIGGVLPCLALSCWLFLHQTTLSRIHDVGMLNLRENWAMPMILCQVLCLHRLLVSHPDLRMQGCSGSPRDVTYRRWVWAFRLTTLACLLLWQFSAFAFMLQVAAVFLCVLLACEPGSRQALVDLLTSQLLCAAAAILLLFGNELLVHHMLVTECISVLVVLRLRPRPPSPRLLFWVDGALAVVVFVGLRVIQSRWATADEHVGEIFIAKFRQLYPDLLGTEKKEPTFNARLYFAVSVFDFISWDTIKTALPTKLYHFAGVGGAVWIAGFIGHVLFGVRMTSASQLDPDILPAARGDALEASESSESHREGLRQRRIACNDKSSASATSQVAHAGSNGEESRRLRAPRQDHSWANAFGQGVLLAELALFLPLGCFISRLKVIGAPFLCALAAVAVAPQPLDVAMQPMLSRWPRFGKWVRFAVLLAAGVAQAGQLVVVARCMPFLQGHALDEHKDWSWADGDRGELYHWLSGHLLAGTTVITSMPLSAELRLNTRLRFAIHPQFEARSLRDRVQEVYEFYMCTPPERMGAIMRKYDSRHIILEYKRCDFSPFLLDNHPELNCQKEDRPWKDLFCPMAHVSPHFELLFANAAFAVFRLREDEEVASVVKKRKGKVFEIHDLKVWQPMLKQCLEEDGDSCVARTAELAAMFYSKIGQRQVSETLFNWVKKHATRHGISQFIIGHHLDYGAKQAAKAGEYYRRAYELAPNNPYIAREYLMWVDMEAKDNRTLEAFLRRRRFARDSLQSILELRDVPLSCEAAVTVRDLLQDQDWAEELWEFAVEHGVGSKCVKNNWPLFHKDTTLEAHLGTLGILLNVFWHRRMRSDIGSAAGSSARYQHPRPVWSFGSEIGARA